MGFKSPVGNTRNETKPPPEAKRGRATDRVKEPERSGDRLPARAAPKGVSAANQITSRNRGHKVQVVIGELDQYIRGWLNHYKLSSTYSVVKDLSEWVRRRTRLYYWKQWNAA